MWTIITMTTVTDLWSLGCVEETAVPVPPTPGRNKGLFTSTAAPDSNRYRCRKKKISSSHSSRSLEVDVTSRLNLFSGSPSVPIHSRLLARRLLGEYSCVRRPRNAVKESFSVTIRLLSTARPICWFICFITPRHTGKQARIHQAENSILLVQVK